MGKVTGIEWCDSTFNPWMGCQKVSPACDHCYAEHSAPARVMRAKGTETWGPKAVRHRTGEKNWGLPITWNAEAERTGKRRRVFCLSLGDVFDNEVPWQWRLDLFDLISRTPNLDWLLLTKRIGNVRPMLDEIQVHGALVDVFPNVWLGITICNQPEADRDISKLLAVPAAKRFLSIEPMLGPINLGLCDCDHGSIPGPHNAGGVMCPKCRGTGGRMVDWVICGGESGPHARPMHPDWAASLRDQCEDTEVPFFFKQWGEWAPAANFHPIEYAGHEQCYVRLKDGTTHTTAPDDHSPYEASDALMVCIGKPRSGRALDRRFHSAFPKVA